IPGGYIKNLVTMFLRLDLLLTGLLLLMFLAVSKAGIGLDKFFQDTYTRYMEHLSKRNLVEPREWLFIVLMAANVVIVYAVYRLRQYGGIQNLSQLDQQREHVALFSQETELLDQLRTHGIVFQDPRKASPVR
ncbi:hypothetical protein KR074_007345, partial [Drosophila pseudoananassae]